jgi:hypothetical protein
MTPKLKRLTLAAALLIGANVLYARTATATVLPPCGGGCKSSNTCTGGCVCEPMIGTKDPGVCTSW